MKLSQLNIELYLYPMRAKSSSSLLPVQPNLCPMGFTFNKRIIELWWHEEVHWCCSCWNIKRTRNIIEREAIWAALKRKHNLFEQKQPARQKVIVYLRSKYQTRPCAVQNNEVTIIDEWWWLHCRNISPVQVNGKELFEMIITSG